MTAKMVPGKEIISDQTKKTFKASAQNTKPNPQYKINNTTLSKEMVCQESVDGNITCELDDKPDITFSIDELSGNKTMQEDYMCGHFDESCVFSFAEGLELEVIERSVEIALQDYDRIVFGMSKLHNGDDLTKVQKFLPELKNSKEPSAVW